MATYMAARQGWEPPAELYPGTVGMRARPGWEPPANLYPGAMGRVQPLGYQPNVTMTPGGPFTPRLMPQSRQDFTGNVGIADVRPRPGFGGNVSMLPEAGNFTPELMPPSMGGPEARYTPVPQAPEVMRNVGTVVPLGGRAEISAAPLGRAPLPRGVLEGRDQYGNRSFSDGRTPAAGAFIGPPGSMMQPREVGLGGVVESRGAYGEPVFSDKGARPFANTVADESTDWGRQNLAAAQAITDRSMAQSPYAMALQRGPQQPERVVGPFSMARGPGGPDYSFADQMQSMALDRLGKAQYAQQRDAAMEMLRGVPQMRREADLSYYQPRQFEQTQALEREKMASEMARQKMILGGQMDQTRYQYDALGGMKLEEQKRDQAFQQQQLGLATTAAQQKAQREPLMAMYNALNDPTTQAGVMARYGIDPKKDPERYNAQLSTLTKWLEGQLGIPQPPALASPPPSKGWFG